MPQIQLTELRPLRSARVLQQSDVAILITAPGQWHHSATATFELSNIEKEARTVIVRMTVEIGELGVGWLSAEGSSWVHRKFVARTHEPVEVAVTVPAGTVGGRLVFENASSGGRSSVALIEEIRPVDAG